MIYPTYKDVFKSDYSKNYYLVMIYPIYKDVFKSDYCKTYYLVIINPIYRFCIIKFLFTVF